jgi:hypothetical protein
MVVVDMAGILAGNECSTLVLFTPEVFDLTRRSDLRQPNAMGTIRRSEKLVGEERLHREYFAPTGI